MRDWSTEETAEWWKEQDSRYQRTLMNNPSANYLKAEMKFKSVLEVGSGTGRLINMFKNKKAGAMDINPYLLMNIDKKIKTYCGDISKTAPEDTYELVYTYQCLQHMGHDEFVAALENIKKTATKEIWLMEGYVAGVQDGDRTHGTGSYWHDYPKYAEPYRIDSLHDGKVLIHRIKV